MCSKAVLKYPSTLEYVPANLKTQEMCLGAVENSLCNLEYVPDHLVTEEMREKEKKREQTIEEWGDLLYLFFKKIVLDA